MQLAAFDFDCAACALGAFRWKGVYSEAGMGPLIEGMKAAKSRRVGMSRVVDLTSNNINNSTRTKIEAMFSKELVKV